MQHRQLLAIRATMACSHGPWRPDWANTPRTDRAETGRT